MNPAPLSVRAIPAFQDNYIWVLTCPETGEVAVVDPGDGKKTELFLRAEGLLPSQIWLTHHHSDHTGGVNFLLECFRCEVMASGSDRPDRLPRAEHYLREGDHFLFAGRVVQVLETPGHTLGAISFYLPEEAMLFCGDTLFSMGCGRLFEGTPALLWESLLKIRSLPPDTRIFCAHEYTEANLRFALSLTPENTFLKDFQKKVKGMRKKGGASLPSLLSEEIQGNPFLKADSPELCEVLGMQGRPSHEVFAKIRSKKDHF